jgi:S1-C subfamily serine protease
MMKISIHLHALLSLSMLLSVSGCAISSNFGESDLVSVKERFGLDLPTNSQFSLKTLGSDRYYLAVHQGSPLIVEGVTRAKFLKVAAERVATDACKTLGKSVSDLRLQQRGEAGWVSLVGEFACASPSLPAPTPVPVQSEPIPATTFEPIGTGVFVNATGELVTNKHVTDGCTAFAVVAGHVRMPATLRASDDALDLAALSVDVISPSHPPIRSARADKLGETVIVAGYPLQGLLGSGLNVTTGERDVNSVVYGPARSSQF